MLKRTSFVFSLFGPTKFLKKTPFKFFKSTLRQDFELNLDLGDLNLDLFD